MVYLSIIYIYFFMVLKCTMKKHLKIFFYSLHFIYLFFPTTIEWVGTWVRTFFISFLRLCGVVDLHYLKWIDIRRKRRGQQVTVHHMLISYKSIIMMCISMQHNLTIERMEYNFVFNFLLLFGYTIFVQSVYLIFYDVFLTFTFQIYLFSVQLFHKYIFFNSTWKKDEEK